MIRSVLALLVALSGPAAAHDAPIGAAAAADYEQGRRQRGSDSVRAMAHFEAAARLHHPAAMFALSNMLAAGEGAARDETAARRWLERAADLDYPEALQQMALHLHDGSLGYPRDEQRAAQLMRAVAHALQHRRGRPER